MFAGLLNKTATTSRATISKDVLGADKLTYATNLEYLPCRLQQTGAQELETVTDGGNVLVAEKKLWADVGTDIVATDRVVIDSTTYEVVTVDPDVAGAGHHMDCTLREVRT